MKTCTVIILLIIFLQNTRGGETECPKICTCKWKNGKQTVSCINRGYIQIPDRLDSATQVLDFSGNKLIILEDELFVHKKIVNLQRIYLSKCGLLTIEKRAFKDLTNLIDLDLSSNELTTVPTDAFDDIPSLMRLSLKRNGIKKIDNFAFSRLSYLNTLELSYCNLCDVGEGAFDGLGSLEWLHLDGNNLTTVAAAQNLPSTLKGVELQNNPWQCDCHMTDFYTWLVDFSVPLSIEPKCSGPPRLEGKTVKSVRRADFACLPDISPTTFYLELSEGKNVSLVCYVNAVPEAKVSWWFHGQMLQNNTSVAPGLHLVYFIEEGALNKKSELFLYNANVNDNGTFSCSAENAAGHAQANFTIRVVLKKEPIVIIVSMKFEYLIAILVGIGIVASLLVLVLILLIIRCLRKRGKRKRGMKPEAYPADRESYVKTIPDNSYNTGIDTPKSNDDDDVDGDIALRVSRERNAIYLQAVPNPIRSPSSLVRYQIEQGDPDVINGAHVTIGLRENGDGEDVGRLHGFTDNVDNDRTERRKFLMDSDGYPSDYGLPRIVTANDNFYRTLPSSNAARMKYRSAANPTERFSREAEFLSRSTFDRFHSDIRYTADGYPERIDSFSSLSSPPESFRSESGLRKMHSRPDNLHSIKEMNAIIRRCTSAQTDDNDDFDMCERERGSFATVDEEADVLTASPDEGYEGEPSVV